MLYSVDAHAIGRHLTGNEVYVRNLLTSFASLEPDLKVIAYVSSREARSLVPRGFRTPLVSSNPFVRLGYDLSRRLIHDRPALLHVQYTAPLYCNVPVVVSVHDVSFLERPEFFPWYRARQLRYTVRRTVASAARVLTGTEFARESILRAYGLPPERVVVIPNAASSDFRVVGRDLATGTVKRRFEIHSPFLLSVGDLQPRKNHLRLIDAFNELVREFPQFPHQLVLAGKDTWFGGNVREYARRSPASARIRFTGFVTDDELLHLYNAADLFVFPSFYEGFGIPALEAMACGRAVACSNTSALPEVVDGAAILFDPASVRSIAQSIADLLRHPELRSRMERLGVQRASRFSWDNTARKTLEVYRQVAGLDAAPKMRQNVPAPAAARSH